MDPTKPALMREGIQRAFATVPVSEAARSAVLVTVVAVPDTITAASIDLAVSAVSTLIQAYTGHIITGKLTGFVADQVISEVGSRVAAAIKNGRVLGAYRFRLHSDGAHSVDVLAGIQPLDLTWRGLVLQPIGAYDPRSGASPVKVITPDPLSAAPEDQVVDTVRRFNADQTVAVRDLTPSLLAVTTTGRWLTFQQRYIQDLVDNNLFEVQAQIAFTVNDVNVEGSTATVVTEETWQTTKYDRTTETCYSHQPTFTSTQTYTLVQEENAWRISQVRVSPAFPDDISGC
jgi:hypothetical protein